jgi:hypothetical protein
MTELSRGDDGFLRMDQFSDAEIEGDELGDEPWYADPEPLGAAAWSRVLAGAVSDTDARPELDDLVAPAPDDPVPDDPVPDDPGPIDEPGIDEFGSGAMAAQDGWGSDEPMHRPEAGTDEPWPPPPDAHDTPDG